jgi:ACS family tartrate transporter-like MFS transporter
LEDAAIADIGAAALRKVRGRLVWIMVLATLVAMMDRTNLSFAALGMSKDVGVTPHVLGVGTSLFFVAYLVAEIPSNLMLWKVGARTWIARIMISWGVVSGLMAAIQTPAHFYLLRFLLGMAEAGFLPGMFLYLSLWVPEAYRGRFNGYLLFAIPIAGAVTAAVSGAILQLHGLWGLAGWRLIFLFEALPALVLGLIILAVLPDRPAAVKWLSAEEKAWMQAQLAREAPASTGRGSTLGRLGRIFARPEVLVLCVGYLGLNVVLSTLLWVPQVLEWGHVAGPAIPLYAGLASAVAAAGMIAWTHRSDRRLERRGHLAAAGVVGALGFVLAALGGTSLAVVAGIALATVGAFAAMAIFWTAPPALLAAEDRPAGIAAISLLGILAGMVTPIVVGDLRQASGGYAGPLLLAAAGSLVCAAGFWLANGMRNRAVALEDDRRMEQVG